MHASKDIFLTFPALNFEICKFPLEINLFINSDAILNRDALWSIQGKNHHVNAAIVRRIRRTGQILRWMFSQLQWGYVNQYSKHFMPSVCTYGVMDFK